jgi:hypothetical protein
MSTPAEWQIFCDECKPSENSPVYLEDLPYFVGQYRDGVVYYKGFDRRIADGDLFVELPER